ncbi:MAG: phospho-N-acetylmuramoyl-pentapeptide-transferase [Anaerolineae bacterium]|nr:phospho-N-acetylmuramoyl-pentapeptide-transferase [Anaerolineae bacterium]
MDIQLPLALTVGGVTFLLGVIWGGPFVEVLRRLGIGKQIREEIRDVHQHKVGTPTMGGIMIIVPTVLITLALNVANIVQTGQGASVLLPIGVLVSFAFLGFIDDWEGIQMSRGIVGEGISSRTKLIGQLVLAGLAAFILSQYGEDGFSFANSLQLPLLSGKLSLPAIIFIPVTMFIIVGMSNAFNLTDGMDSLAGLITSSAFAAYGVIAFIQGQVFIVQLCFTIVGACFAFLWFNAPPADLFMGDTGSLALGATLGVVAVMTGEWLLLPIIAIVPVVETLSVILQVASAKLSRRYLGEDIRPFRRTPLHHHFELSGWKETQVVHRFWLVGLLSAMIGVALALL